MALEVGIVGLPQVGKSTIFNAMTGGHADTGSFARADKPNIGVAKIPDERLRIITELIPTKKVVPATLQMVDVAGLTRGASTGQGLGNKFLGHIRDMDAILHVIRCFESTEVPHSEGSIDPVRDIDTVETELILADLETVSNSLDRAKRFAKSGDKEAVVRAELLERAYEKLNASKPVRELELTADQKKQVKSMGLLTAKKTLFVANVGEEDNQGASDQITKARQRAESEGGLLVAVCGKLEAEIAQLPEADRGEMLSAMGLKEPALAVLARAAYRLLGLHSFLTIGDDENRAWTIPIGAKALQAAGAVHSDLEKSFIKAEVHTVQDLVEYNTEAAIKLAGKLRLEGKEYVVQDGDVIHFQAGLAGRR